MSALFHFKLKLYIIILFFSMEGGELFQRIQDRQDGAFTERGEMWETVVSPCNTSVNYTT
jgi:hypothetical protein